MIQIYFCTFICYPFPLRKDWIDHIHFKDSSYNISPTFVTLSINTYVRITHLLCNLSWELRGFYLLNVPYNYLVILIKKVFYKKKNQKKNNFHPGYIPVSQGHFMNRYETEKKNTQTYKNNMWIIQNVVPWRVWTRNIQ